MVLPAVTHSLNPRHVFLDKYQVYFRKRTEREGKFDLIFYEKTEQQQKNHIGT